MERDTRAAAPSCMTRQRDHQRQPVDEHRVIQPTSMPSKNFLDGMSTAKRLWICGILDFCASP